MYKFAVWNIIDIIVVECTASCILEDVDLNQISRKKLKGLSRGHLLINVVEANEELGVYVLNMNVDL